MSHSIIRLACSLAVVCGVSLRPMALSFSSLFLLPITQSALQRGMDDLGSHVPRQEEMLQPLRALTPATACQIDGYDPRGTAHWVMVVKDEPERLLMTQEVGSEHGAEARKFLQKCKDHGRHVTAAFADDSPSFTEALTAVYPQARLPADHVHTVKHSWGHLKTALLAYRRKRKASGAAQNDEDGMALAKTLWQWRWRLLKNPTN
jgi:Transposase